VLELSIFRFIDNEDNHADVDEAGNSDEEDTKKSFDFAGEIPNSRRMLSALPRKVTYDMVSLAAS
jgi:hypothetical protein